MAKYTLDVSVTQFGTLYDNTNALVGINAFKDWVKTSTNDLLELNINYIYSPDLLTLSELNYSATSNCYFFDPKNMNSAHKSLIPPNCACNFILWNNQTYPPCQGGSDWGNDGGSNLQMWNSIPINNFWNTSYNIDICSYSLNGLMAHEFLNMLNDILHGFLGFSDILSEFSSITIPGCITGVPCSTCRTSRMAQLTPAMCNAMLSNGYAIKAAMGALDISSNPLGAEIFIEGEDTGTVTHSVIPNIPVGRYTLKLTSPGYNDYTTTFTIYDGLTTTLNPTLSSVTIVNPVVLTVNVSPPNSGVVLVTSPIGTRATTTSMQINISSGSNVKFYVSQGAGYNFDHYEDKWNSNIFTSSLNPWTDIIASNDIVTAVLVPTTGDTGTLDVSSNPPGAEIFIDSVDRENVTPNVISGINIGNHELKLYLAGYLSHTTTFTISAGATTTLRPTLIPIPPTTGTLVVFSTPYGAIVLVDNRLVGGTPTSRRLSAGTHTLRLSLAGYQDYTKTFTITAGQTTYLSPTLIPVSPTGSLYVTSTPLGAEIFIDSVDQEKVTISPFQPINNISVGTHTLKLTLAGYQDSTTTFPIFSGFSTPLNATLTPNTVVNPVVVTLNVSPQGAGTATIATPIGNRTTSTSTNITISSGSSVTFSVIPNTGYKFDSFVDRWDGNMFTTSSNPWTDIMGGNDVVTAVLVPTTGDTGTLDVSSNPIGAEIIIDGEDKLKVTPSVIQLPVGNHSLTLKLAGYQDYNINFTIYKDTTTTFSC
jgi:hypothetical protein